MSDPIQALILDLLEWIALRPRPYAEVIDAWRTSCPRLPVWEEVTEREYAETREGDDGVLVVSVTALGLEFLNRHRGVSE